MRLCHACLQFHLGEFYLITHMQQRMGKIIISGRINGKN